MNHNCCRLGLLCLLLFASVLGCNSQSQQIKEKPPEPGTLQPGADTEATDKPRPAQLSPPALPEVRAALARIYHDNLVLAPQPSYVVGDFNGDASQDLAVVAVPRAAAIARLNDELANWIVQQARNPKTDVRPEVKQGDRLLAIVHGQGERGWRSSEARQSYLLREAAGLQLRAQPFRSLNRSGEPPPMFAGRDVIHQKLRGETGYLYWDGAHYRWRPDL